MIIYRAWGILVIPFAAAGGYLSLWFCGKYGFTHELFPGAAVVAFAALCIFTGYVVNGVFDTGSRLFFINMEVWGYLAVSVAAGLYGTHIRDNQLGSEDVKAEAQAFFNRLIDAPSPVTVAQADTLMPNAKKLSDIVAALKNQQPLPSPAGALSAPTSAPVTPAVAVASPPQPASGQAAAAPPERPSAFIQALAANAQAAPPVDHVDPAPAPRSNSLSDFPKVQWSHEYKKNISGAVDDVIKGFVAFEDGSYANVSIAKSDEGEVDFDITTFSTDGKGKDFVFTDSKETSAQVRLDSAPPHDFVSAERWTNQLSVGFLELKTIKKLKGLDQPYDARGLNGPQQFVSGAIRMGAEAEYDQLKATMAGTVKQLLAARSVLVELRFEDGSSNIVDLDPTDPIAAAYLQNAAIGFGLGAAAPEPAPASGPRAAWCGNPRSAALSAADVEDTICGDAQLSRIDIDFGALFQNALNKTAQFNLRDTRASLFAGRKKWLRSRNSCGAETDPTAKKKCIIDTYTGFSASIADMFR